MEMYNQPAAEIVKDYHAELIQKIFYSFMDK